MSDFTYPPIHYPLDTSPERTWDDLYDEAVGLLRTPRVYEAQGILLELQRRVHPDDVTRKAKLEEALVALGYTSMPANYIPYNEGRGATNDDNRPHLATPRPQNALYVKNKTRFAQLIDLTWRAGYYKHANSDQVQLTEVYKAYSDMLHENLSAQRGNVHNLYKEGNYKALHEELAEVAQTAEQIQKSILAEIDRLTTAIHQEKNP